MGEGRRQGTWTTLFTASGAEVHPLVLLRGGRRLRPHAGPRDLLDLTAGRIVPEVLAWSPDAAVSALAALHPDVTIFITSRAYRPRLAQVGGTAVLDFVDELSTSYTDRAAIASEGRARSAGFRVLAAAHRRFERGRPPGLRCVAAGFEDASRLHTDWVPVLAPIVEGSSDAAPALSADLLFLGNLEYPPNVDAIRQLDRLWPEFETGTTMVLAGRSPSAEVRAMAARRGWHILRDFDSLAQLRGVASIAVAPLRYAAGIQMKVLDAAALGIAQVVTPAGMRGMAPGFPVKMASVGPGFVAAVSDLLDDDTLRETLARDAQAHVRENYSVQAWAHWAERLLPPSA